MARLKSIPWEFYFEILTLLRWSFWYNPPNLNPRNLNPRNFHFWSVFHSKPYLHQRQPQRNWYQKMWNFLAHILIFVKSLPHSAFLPKRPRKIYKYIFHFHFPGNWFDIGIILSDFWNFTIWAFQIQVLLTELQNLKIPKFILVLTMSSRIKYQIGT